MKFNLVKAHGENYDPYRVGINYRRLGLSVEKMMSSYHKSAYPESWFEGLRKGYEANDLESDADEPNIDTHFLMRQLVKQAALKEFTLLGTKCLDSEKDSYFIPGQGRQHFAVFHHKTLALLVVAVYHISHHTDGSQSQHWSLCFCATVDERPPLLLSKGFRIKEVKSDLDWHACGTSCSSDFFSTQIESRSTISPDHTSKVALVIKKFVQRVQDLNLSVAFGRAHQKPYISITVGNVSQETFWDGLLE